MATLILPSWFNAAECEMQLVPEVRGFQGPYGGPSEVYDLLGDRWRMRITMPDGDFAAGARAEAFFNRLRGGADWLALHHLARPAPRGTARGSMTLSAGVSQGASSLALAGLVPAPNLITNGSFEVDTDANGIANGWSAYSAGTTGTVSHARTNTSPAHGSWRQRCSATGLGITTADRLGITRGNVAVTAGLSYTLSAYMVAATGTGLMGALYVDFLDAGNALAGAMANASISLTSSLVRYSVSGVAPPTAVKAVIYVWAHSLPGGPGLASLEVDAVQFEQASAPTAYAGLPTLLAGDMLGHGGEQLFQVYEDATATDAGAVTVSTVNRARKAIASGQAINWSAPTVPFMLLDAGGVPTRYGAGRSPGQTVTFEEAWA